MPLQRALPVALVVPNGSSTDDITAVVETLLGHPETPITKLVIFVESSALEESSLALTESRGSTDSVNVSTPLLSRTPSKQRFVSDIPALKALQSKYRQVTTLLVRDFHDISNFNEGMRRIERSDGDYINCELCFAIFSRQLALQLSVSINEVSNHFHLDKSTGEPADFLVKLAASSWLPSHYSESRVLVIPSPCSGSASPASEGVLCLASVRSLLTSDVKKSTSAQEFLSLLRGKFPRFKVTSPSSSTNLISPVQRTLDSPPRANSNIRLSTKDNALPQVFPPPKLETLREPPQAQKPPPPEKKMGGSTAMKIFVGLAATAAIAYVALGKPKVEELLKSLKQLAPASVTVAKPTSPQ